MPNYKNLGIAQGIAEGLEKSTSNLMSIMMTGNKLRRENEIFQADKKIQDLELKKLEHDLSPEQLAAERETSKLENTAKKTAIELSLKQNERAESKERRTMEEHERDMDLTSQILNDGADTLPYGSSLKAGGFTMKAPTEEQAFSSDVKNVIDKKTTWQDLKNKYPTKVDDIKRLKQQHTLLIKDEDFGKIKDFFGREKDVNINEATQYAIDNIENKADLVDLIENEQKYADSEIDVDLIYEYFGLR